MKKIITTFLLVGFCTVGIAQSKVKEKDILGEWKLVIDIDRDEIEREIEEEDNWFAARFAKAVSNFALDIVEEIDIQFDFRKDGEVRIYAEVFGADEVEYAKWHINDEGQLIIEDDHRERRRGSKKVHFGDDSDVWMMENKKLVAYDISHRGKLEKQEVYMVKK